MRTQAELLVDVLSRLNQGGFDYMLTGSMAGNYWGVVRTTHDVDIVFTIEPARADAFAAAFETGFFVQRKAVHDAFRPPHQFNFADESSASKVDFWLLRDDAFDRCAFGRRLVRTLFGVEAWITTPEDLILGKLRWNQLSPSNKQVLDAAGIFAVQQGLLDLDYLRRWATHLGVAIELEDVLSGKIRPKTT